MLLGLLMALFHNISIVAYSNNLVITMVNVIISANP